MSIGFHTIPATIRTPGVFVEFDGSRAVRGLSARPNEVLIIAQMLAAGSATANLPISVSSADEAVSFFGPESQAHEMVKAYKALDSLSPVWVCPVIDDAGGVAAAGSFGWTGTATQSRSLILYIGGRRIEVPVASGDTAAVIETAALAAIALVSASLPVTVTADAAAGIDVTARHKGTIGNQIMLGVCLQPGEHVPAGIAVVITAMASGATDTVLTGAIAAMGEDQYTTLAVGNSATTEVARVVTELESRWQAMRAIEGSAFVGRYDTRANLTTYGNTFNSGLLVVAEGEKSALLPLPWELAAQSAAISALQDQNNPARGSQGASYAGFASAARGSRYTRAERDILLSDGVATTKAGSDGRLLVDRFVTTYQTNPLGLVDTALQDHSTVRLLAAIRYTWRARVGAKFPNWLLADDGNEIPGQQIVTPKIMRAEAIAWYGDLCDAGWAQNPAQFAAEVLVQRDASDPNRINMILPTNLMRNLLVTAAQIAYA